MYFKAIHTKVIGTNLNWNKLGSIRKFRPKRFNKIDSRNSPSTSSALKELGNYYYDPKRFVRFWPGLPYDIFLYQKSQSGNVLVGLEVENIGIFDGHLDFLLSFGYFVAKISNRPLG
jgi:hypothetical protein